MSQALADLLLSVDDVTRLDVLAQLAPAEREALAGIMDDMLGSPYGRYRYDPCGFVENVLNESLWSKQREILDSIRDNKRTAVPACHAPGKSHIAARAVAWWAASHPPGTALALTTATTFRQVRSILWQHIRRVAARHNLPGEVLTTEWKIDGNLVSFGFSAGDNDEAAVQGIHVPNLLIVVDEAGGISHTLGQAFESLMTGANTRLLCIGNPATDSNDSWFERACSNGLFNTIPIDVYSTPNFTGEDAGVCQSCPPGIREHGVATHLVDRQWTDDVVREFGDDSPFVIARVHARFPKSSVSSVIPVEWAEAALVNQSAEEGTVRLGVDVASDGGDEFVIAEADGMVGRIVGVSAGAQNANAVDAAGRVLEAILAAEAKHEARNIGRPVRVKIDALGVGWGVVSLLETWRKENRFKAEIVGVKVSEKAADPERYSNQRSAHWWNVRQLLQPDDTGEGQIRLEVERKVIAQMAAPKFSNDSAGRIQIEKKETMKRRGVTSPDRAEALLLAFYEPPSKRREAPIIAPIGMAQDNPFGGL